PDATRFSLRGARGSLIVTPEREAVLVVAGLPRAPAGRTYEVWVVTPGRTLPAGLFTGGKEGSLVALSRPVPEAAAVAASVERAGPSTWILTLVHRRAVGLRRREQRRRADPLESAPDPSGRATDEEVALLSKRRIVQDALRQLPDDQREALELAYYGGFTQS